MYVLYSPIQLEWIGLSDGEAMERMSMVLPEKVLSMTKEMRPSHRVDVLSPMHFFIMD